MGRECFHEGKLCLKMSVRLWKVSGPNSAQKMRNYKRGEAESFVLHLTTSRDLPAGVKSIKKMPIH